MKSTILWRLDFESDNDLVLARKRAREVSSALGFDVHGQTRIATAVSEALRELVAGGPGASLEFLLDGEGHRCLCVQIDAPLVRMRADMEAGPPDWLRRIEILRVRLQGLVDTIEGSLEPPMCTLSKKIPRTAASLTEVDIQKLRQDLGKLEKVKPYDESLQQNEEVLRMLNELNRRNDDLGSLNSELEETNRGVLALYAELEERADHFRQANETRKHFLSNMTHEFRTPVNSILALCGLLLDPTVHPLEPEQMRQVTYIRTSASDLQSLINNLLDQAKAESGTIAVQPETFTIEDFFGTLRGMMRPLMAGNITLEFRDPAGIPPLFTDQGKVAQVLRNLISNALKFTESGTVSVSAKASSDQNEISITVSDTGIGIPTEAQQTIFLAYEQLDSVLQRRTKGTGLGLPIAKRLTEALGGRIELISSPGAGSCFTVFLPTRYTGSGQISMVGEQRQTQKRPSRVTTALIIDDNEPDRYLLVHSIADRCASILEAVNGETGIALAVHHRPDIIFLDLNMPGIDGFEVLHRLQADKQTRRIPVVIFTSRTIDPETREALRGARAIFSKDASVRDQTRQQIQSLLDGIQ